MEPRLHQIRIDWTGATALQGALVEVHGLGVLLTGTSGVGKSELALDLVSRGHRLIADDIVEVINPATGILLARCPELLRDYLEVRGLGVINVRAMYGDGAVAPMQRLDLILHLESRGETAPDTEAEALARISGRRGEREVLGVRVPEIYLRARLGHNQRALVEAACRDHWLRLFGSHADRDFIARQKEAVSRDQH
jgi:HPr kinase/phosphorylase